MGAFDWTTEQIREFGLARNNEELEALFHQWKQRANFFEKELEAMTARLDSVLKALDQKQEIEKLKRAFQENSNQNKVMFELIKKLSEK